jgi:hypothetical protein
MNTTLLFAKLLTIILQASVWLFVMKLVVFGVNWLQALVSGVIRGDLERFHTPEASSFSCLKHRHVRQRDTNCIFVGNIVA